MVFMLRVLCFFFLLFNACQMFLKNLLENSYTKVPRSISISEMLLKNKSVMKSVAAKITIIDEPQPIDLLNLLSR